MSSGLTLQQILHLILWQIIKEAENISFVLEELKTKGKVELTLVEKQRRQQRLS